MQEEYAVIVRLVSSSSSRASPVHNTDHGSVCPSKALTGCFPSVWYECAAGCTPRVVLPPLALSTKSDAFVTGDPELEASRFEKATASCASIVERRWFRVLSLERREVIRGPNPDSVPKSQRTSTGRSIGTLVVRGTRIRYDDSRSAK